MWPHNYDVTQKKKKKHPGRYLWTDIKWFQEYFKWKESKCKNTSAVCYIFCTKGENIHWLKNVCGGKKHKKDKQKTSEMGYLERMGETVYHNYPKSLRKGLNSSIHCK